MSALLEHRALRRKIAAHTRPIALAPDISDAGSRAFGRALRRAAGPFDGLGLALGAVTVNPAQTLEGAIAALPEHGLAAALEEAGGQRGLIGLSPGLIDALIEVQTTGRVEATALPPRPVTRIDEAMARDFIDLALSAFDQESQTVVDRNWPDQMGYGSRIEDRGRLNLLLPEASYVIFTAEIGFDGVDRRAQIMMAIPQKLGVRTTTMGLGAAPKPASPAWVAAREHLLAELQLSFEVVLMRVVRPLAEVERLSVGDLLPFTEADLQELAMEDAGGRVILHGRLGQLGGRRALRLGGMVPKSAPAAELGAGPLVPAPLGMIDPIDLADFPDPLAVG